MRWLPKWWSTGIVGRTGMWSYEAWLGAEKVAFGHGCKTRAVADARAREGLRDWVARFTAFAQKSEGRVVHNAYTVGSHSYTLCGKDCSSWQSIRAKDAASMGVGYCKTCSTRATQLIDEMHDREHLRMHKEGTHP